MLQGNPMYRILYAVWAFFECLIFGGLIYGWASLVFVLKKEGLYSHLCTDSEVNVSTANVSQLNGSDYTFNATLTPKSKDNDHVAEKSCRDMDDRLSLVFTVGTAVFCIGCFIMGQISYIYGTRITRLVGTTSFVIGSLLIAFTSKDVPWLIFPGLSLIGSGGITFLMTNMQISVFFPKLSTLIVGLFCGGFDTSAGMQLLVKIGYENGISRQTSYIILACANLITLVSTFLFLPKDFIKNPPISKRYTVAADVAEDKAAVVELKSGHSEEPEQHDTTVKPTLWSCIFSCRYLFHVFWLSILQLRFYFFLGSLNTTLTNLLHGDVEEVSRYTNFSTIVLMCGVLSSPFAGIICDLFKGIFSERQRSLQKMLMPTVIPLALTTSLCILMSVLVLVDTPEVMIPAFLCLLFFRSFMYTLGAGYIGVMFPSEYFGILYGIVIIAGGIISMFQYVLLNWAETESFFQVNLFLLILMTSTFIHPAFQWWVCYRDGRTRKLIASE